MAAGFSAVVVLIAMVVNCATAVLLDPTTGNPIAGPDPRRDGYAIAY